MTFICDPLAEIEQRLREEYEPFDREDLPALAPETLEQWIAAWPGVTMELTENTIEPLPFQFDAWGDAPEGIVE